MEIEHTSEVGSVESSVDSNRVAIQKAYDEVFGEAEEALRVAPRDAESPEAEVVSPETDDDGGAAVDTQPAADSEVVDPSLVALAVQLGADEEAVNETVAQDPKRAKELLSQLVSEYNAESMRLISGRPGSRVTETPVTPTSTPSTDQTAFEKLLADETKVAAFKEEHGDALFEMMKAQAESTATLRNELSSLAELRGFVEVQQQDAVNREINSIFQSFGKPYDDFYGTGSLSELTETQLANRGKVGDLAQVMRSGHIASNQSTWSTHEYITRAHHVVAAQLRAEAERQSIIAQLQNREKSFTLKPSAGRAVNSTSSNESANSRMKEALLNRAAELGVEEFFAD